MGVFSQGFTAKTSKQVELVNITPTVKEIIAKSGVREGIVLVYVPHATAGLIVNENEPRLIKDFLDTLKTLIPWNKNYAHNQIDDNAASHLVNSIFGCSISFPLIEGKLSLGTWQTIFLVELDGPRTRQIYVKIVGE